MNLPAALFVASVLLPSCSGYSCSPGLLQAFLCVPATGRVFASDLSFLSVTRRFATIITPVIIAAVPVVLAILFAAVTVILAITAVTIVVITIAVVLTALFVPVNRRLSCS